MDRQGLTTLIVVTVSVCWTFISMISVIENRPLMAEIVTPVMLAVVTVYLTRRNGNGNGNGNREGR